MCSVCHCIFISSSDGLERFDMEISMHDAHDIHDSNYDDGSHILVPKLNATLHGQDQMSQCGG